MSAEAAAVPPQPSTHAQEGQSHEERLAAYEASVFAAFGGRRGLAEVGLPSILFVIVYGLTRNLTGAIWAAVAVAAVLSTVRLVKRDTLQHALGGLAGVLVCAAVAHFSGQAKGFYLPGVLLNIGEAILFSVSALVRFPIVGVVLGPVTGEMMAWREHPGQDARVHPGHLAALCDVRAARLRRGAAVPGRPGRLARSREDHPRLPALPRRRLLLLADHPPRPAAPRQAGPRRRTQDTAPDDEN